MFEVEELLAEGEFAGAGDAVGEEDGDFDDGFGAGFDDELEADFVADGVEGVGIVEAGAIEGEEAGHGVAQAGEGTSEERGAEGVDGAEEAPAFGGVAAGDVAGTEDEVGAVVEAVDHGGDGGGGVREVGIHHDQALALGGAEAFEDGAAEATGAGAFDEMDPGEVECLDDLAGAVAGLIVHEPEVKGEGAVVAHVDDGGGEGGEVEGFAEGGDDDGDVEAGGCGRGRRRGRGDIDSHGCEWGKSGEEGFDHEAGEV